MIHNPIHRVKKLRKQLHNLCSHAKWPYWKDSDVFEMPSSAKEIWHFGHRRRNTWYWYRSVKEARREIPTLVRNGRKCIHELCTDRNRKHGWRDKYQPREWMFDESGRIGGLFVQVEVCAATEERALTRALRQLRVDYARQKRLQSKVQE